MIDGIRPQWSRSLAMSSITMKSSGIIVHLILAVALAGCAPNMASYYRPSVMGGQLRTPSCVPTESLVDFTVGNGRVQLPIRAFADDGKYVRQVALFFSRGSWKTFHFVSTDFRIHDLDKNITIQPAAVRVFSEHGMAPLTTAPFSLPDAKQPIRFNVQITLPGRMPDNFELLSPSIVIDGEEMAFPPMRFERKVWTGISPLNC